MKKTLVLLLALLLCVPCLPCFAEEAEAPEREIFTSGDYEYALLDDGTAEITRYRGEAEELDIPDELDGHSVTAIGDNALSFCGSLTNVSIPDSVTAIGDSAFSNCKSLLSVNIPDSVKAIGANPFRSCTNLTAISVSPDNPTLATIGGVLFSKLDKRLVCYPVAFTSEQYEIPQGIEIIGDSAFSSCESFTSVIIPDSVTAIGDNAFSGCKSLTNVTIPDSVTAIGANLFTGCTNLADIIVSPDHPVLATIGGVLFSKPDNRLLCCPCALVVEQYEIPQGIEIIGDYAFSECKSLMSIIIPDSVTAIGDYTFLKCSSLTSVSIPDSVAAIGNNVFGGCDSLMSVSIPDSVTAIGDNTFYNCDSLTSVRIPDSVTAIGDDAFDECDNLKEVIVGRESYAKQYCIDNDLPYTYADANDWLND